MGGGFLIQPNNSAGLLAALMLLVTIVAACGPATPELAPTVQPLVTLPPDQTPVIVLPTPETFPPAVISPTPAVEILPTFTIAVDDIGEGDLPDYYGGLVITLDYVGQTIFMKPGQGFLFQLGDSFDWEITVDPPQVLTINQRYIPLEGEQGVYIAREKGKATIRAIGSPRCLQNNPPCARPNVLFTLYVEVAY